jgi:uncharacterized protein (DUF488 family)
MFSRQRALLRLIENDGGSLTKLRLVKLAFLMSMETKPSRVGVYDFVPYKHGPFSFTLYHELSSLERDGWLTQTGKDIALTSHPGKTSAIDGGLLGLIDSVSRRHRGISTKAIVDRVYRDFPWFTVNAEIIQNRAAARPSSKTAVFTTGYEGMMVDALLDLLLRCGIRRLIDVRCNPVARRYGFHKSTLCRLCEDIGVEYIHVAALGVPSAWRADLSDENSYQQLFTRYKDEILPANRNAVKDVAKLMTEAPSALMCMEADHHSCHRSRLGAEISSLTGLPMMELQRN